MQVKLVFIFLLIPFFAYPQQEKLTSANFKNKSFVKVISYLEKTYNIHFSYQSKDISNRNINLTYKNKSLSNILDILGKKTSLIFEVLSNKYIAIRSINNHDIISICGKIKNKKNKLLPDASIIYNGTGLVTNKKGYFKINTIKAGSVIEIKYLGYKTKYIKAKSLYKNKCKSIFLDEQSEQIKTVVIKNYLTNGINKTKDGTVVINPKKLGILAGLTEPDLFQSIQLLPGVSSPNETATGIHVRGGTPDQNLILWDGIKIYHSGHLFGAISPFNPYITDKIEFIDKGTNAKYGESVSSVLNIKTSDSIQHKLNAGIGANLISGDAFIKLPIIKNKFSILASARRSFTDFYQSKAYKETSDIVFNSTQPNALTSTNNNFFFKDYNVKGILKLKNNNYISFTNLLIENNLDFGVKELDDSSPGDDKNSISFKDFLETANKGYGLNWYKKWSSKFKQKINIYYSNYFLLYNKFKTENNLRSLSFAKKNTVKDFGISLNTILQIDKNTTLNSGYEFSNKNVTYFFLSAQSGVGVNQDSNNSNLNTSALYTTLTKTKDKDYYFSAGVRFNYYQNLKKFYIEPRINIGKYLTKNLRLNITGEFKTQAMSKIDETIESGLSLENKLWSIADNKKFPIINAQQYTFGFSYVKKHWHFNIDTYFKNIKGIATLNFGYTDIFDKDAHLGRSKIKGLDIYIKREFKNYATWLSYTFDDSQTKFLGINNNQFFPGNSNLKHNFYWSHTYKWKQFDAALGWRWHTGKPYTKAIAITTNSSGATALQTDGINNFNLPNYNRLDFSATYHFDLSKKDGIKAKLGISYLNLLNRKNVLSRDFFISNSTNTINSADKISLERIFNLVFRVNF